MRRAIERDRASDHIRIAAEAFPPEIFRDQRDIGAFLFVRQKVAAENWANAKHIEVIRRCAKGEQLDRIAQAGECHRRAVIGREPGEHRLSLAPLHEARARDSDLGEATVLGIAVDVHYSLRLMEWQRAQEKVVDQTEDRSVQPDPERQRNDREQSEPGRFEQLTKREAKIDHHKKVLNEMRQPSRLDSIKRRRRFRVLSKHFPPTDLLQALILPSLEHQHRPQGPGRVAPSGQMILPSPLDRRSAKESFPVEPFAREQILSP